MAGLEKCSSSSWESKVTGVIDSEPDLQKSGFVAVILHNGAIFVLPQSAAPKIGDKVMVFNVLFHVPGLGRRANKHFSFSHSHLAFALIHSIIS